MHLLKNKSKRIRIAGPRKVYDVLSIARRNESASSLGQRKPHSERGDIDMAGGRAEQKKRIVPTVLEKFPEKEKK